MKTNTAEDLI